MSTLGIQVDNVQGVQNWTQEHSDALHRLKNTPVRQGGTATELDDLLHPNKPPYVHQSFPAAIYGPWTDERKRNELLQLARLHQLDLTKPLEREKAESLIYEWDTREVKSEREKQDWLDKGWADTPDGVKAAQNRWLDAIALEAAHRAHDDRRMSEAAKAEFSKADEANGEHHLLDLPVPPANRKRGRPKKSDAATAA